MRKHGVWVEGAGMSIRGGLHAGFLPFVVSIVSGLLCASSSAADLTAPADARIVYFEPLQLQSPAPSDLARKADTGTRLEFDAYGKHFEMRLEDNTRFTQLIAADKTSTDSPLKLYRGNLASVPDSWARIAIDTSGVRGLIWDGHDLFVIETGEAVRNAVVPPLQVGTAKTVIFKLADVLLDPASTVCATSDTPGADIPSAERADEAYKTLLQELKGQPALLQAPGATVAIQISALGDTLFRQRYSNDTEARNEILLRLNNVDGIFSSQLGVEIQVPTIDLSGTSNAALSTSTDPSALLAKLAELRKNSPEHRSRGLTHLFTGRNLDGSTVGIAYLDKLCEPQNGVALTEATNRGAWIESLIAAHEIGHNFGAVHDGESTCSATPKGMFLMSTSVQAANSTFSDCSLAAMRPRAKKSASCISTLLPANISMTSDLGTTHHVLAQSFNRQVTITNVGGSTAVDVRVEISLAPQLTIEEAYVVGGTCTSGADAISCWLGYLAAGASASLQLGLRGDTVGSYPLAAVASAANDSSSENNSGDGTVVINPDADVAISIDSPATVGVGDSFVAAFTTSNASDNTLAGVRVHFDLPSGVSAASANMAGGVCSIQATTATCTLASLAAQSSVNGSVVLSAATVGAVTLHAQVSGNYTDPEAANDVAEQLVTVAASTPVMQTSLSDTHKSGGGALNLCWLLSLAALLPFARKNRFRDV
jgi:hypothetical protein